MNMLYIIQPRRTLIFIKFMRWKPYSTNDALYRAHFQLHLTPKHPVLHVHGDDQKLELSLETSGLHYHKMERCISSRVGQSEQKPVALQSAIFTGQVSNSSISLDGLWAPTSILWHFLF